MKEKRLSALVISLFLFIPLFSQNVRETVLLDDDWLFSFGDASSPAKDFGRGTEYFNYFTKAASIHNEGPYSDKFDDSSWEKVTLPHDWVVSLPLDPQASHSHGYRQVGYKYPSTSVGWYRKKISIGEEDLGKHLSLRFDGIFRDATVWFNGFLLGTEPSGYATQVYDISEYVNYGGENLICVRADATFEEGWFYEGAGIYRDVYLQKSSEVSVAENGTFVYSTLQYPYESATIHVETSIENYSLSDAEATVEHRLLNAEGRTVCSSDEKKISIRGKDKGALVQEMTVRSPRLWDVMDPYLYIVETTVKVGGKVVDIYKTRTGIREIAFTSDRGFLLNGAPLKLKGVNMHQDHAGVGSAIPAALHRFRIRTLKEMGCNAYRSSHNPMTPALLDICDEEGILVIDETRLSGINSYHIRLLENMILRDRNHPSIILWSDGNEEWGLENRIQGTRVASSMKQYTHLLDPTRPSTLANSGGGELIKGVDVVGYNYIVQNDVLGRRERYPDWRIVGTEETTGCGTRGVYFDDPEYPGRMRSMNLGTGPGVENVIERGWKFYDETPWASGLFYWTGFDYRGEPNPLKYPATVSEFGLFDYCGFPKDEVWYLMSWWGTEPVLHIFPHWNLSGHEGEKVEIWAYSNCDEVDLSVNGKNLGRKKMPRDGHLKWDAVYKPGKVTARGYKNGRCIITQTIETTGAPSTIALIPDRNTISADGQDLSIIRVEVRDDKGRLVPDSEVMLSFTLEGEGRILGGGNGDPSYLGRETPEDAEGKSFSIPSFGGLAQILVRSGKSPSTLNLSCTASSLDSASAQIVAQ